MLVIAKLEQQIWTLATVIGSGCKGPDTTSRHARLLGPIQWLEVKKRKVNNEHVNATQFLRLEVCLARLESAQLGSLGMQERLRL